MIFIFTISSDLDTIVLFNRILDWLVYESCMPKDTSISVYSKVNNDLYDYMCSSVSNSLIRIFIL